MSVYPEDPNLQNSTRTAEDKKQFMGLCSSDGDSSSEEEKPKKKASPTVTAKKAPTKNKKSGMQSRDR